MSDPTTIYKTWAEGEILYAVDLTASFSYIINKMQEVRVYEPADGEPDAVTNRILWFAWLEDGAYTLRLKYPDGQVNVVQTYIP